ncbi:hypothetical protein C8A01DRAFT_39571 [Parachaetomium inaequale]|uniref:Uncharacterized protein n=1 Tax=Parachaetomium inaequale TaxID=2588326 RepID=A0AAN6PDF5_9PEZI|nr:hypothetical protein C8A01DRAFT_39571 [Parachaetomium inaequale]
MDPESTDPNLLLLSLNLSDSEPEEAAPPTNTTSTSGPTTEYQPTRAERTALSEEAFQALKQSYRPKIENGNISTHTPLPLPLSPTPLPKPAAQELLHAAEELYFFRRYADAATFLRQVLADLGEDEVEEEAEAEEEGGGGKSRGKSQSKRIDGETRRLLGYYLVRCEARLQEGDGDSSVR